MLKLRPYKPFDAETILSWLDSEYTMRIWSGPRHPHFPPPLKELQDLYEGYSTQAVNFPMVAYDEGGAVGVVTLRFLAPDEKEVRLCNILVDPAQRGSGIGRELLAMAVDYSFHCLKAEKVTLGVLDENERAIRCYRAAGFRPLPEDRWRSFTFLGRDWRCMEMEYDPSEQTL